ncbi:hypothetical protein ZWY2020_006145 [Hordeum vulgare]|nr:hypothetical protein ZWY2020_056353 [Hordeum vulgare]KAI5016294.1 hypothetical protein ZWY2020_006145 [Hordeum vulgare]
MLEMETVLKIKKVLGEAYTRGHELLRLGGSADVGLSLCSSSVIFACSGCVSFWFVLGPDKAVFQAAYPHLLSV